MTVAVIMRSRNSDWVIHQALASLASQRFASYELLVVDSGSTDRTLAMVAEHRCRLIQIPGARYQPGPVLNDAIAATQADQLVFWNSDCVALHDGVLGMLVDALAGADAAFARQVPRPDAHGWVRRDYAKSFPGSGEAPPWMALSLVCSSMRRSAWIDHPFYAEAWASEDTEWGVWARSSGRRVAYRADALVMHSHNYTCAQLYGRRFVEGEADAFIHDRRIGLGRALAHGAVEAARDACWSLPRGDLRGAG
ncbi:MAG: glycosyltransferase family 2 protein, partial [Planctomycetes bacterium]|nr:glycosyltransferase family 2 protein [Planctomycetota bacterium]